jgi:ankyrin repeat protein
MPVPAQSAQLMDFFTAIRAGDVERVRSLLAQDPALVNERNERGHTPVLIAQYHHKRDVVALLLAHNPTLDVFDACCVGRAARVAELLDANPALLNAYNSDGFFPLGLAAFFGHPETVTLLLGRGADVSQVARNPMKIQALHAGAAGGHMAVVKLLVDGGAPVDTAQQEGWTPLHAAAKLGDLEMARLLLANGGDSKRPNDKGVSPIGVAAERGDVSMLKLLKG